jgi:hypothetical protein
LQGCAAPALLRLHQPNRSIRPSPVAKRGSVAGRGTRLVIGRRLACRLLKVRSVSKAYSTPSIMPPLPTKATAPSLRQSLQVTWAMLINEMFDTRPLIVHAQGQHAYSPHWPTIIEKFFSSPRRRLAGTHDLTILTWNSQLNEKGIFERSLDHLGVPYMVLGQGVLDWVNSRDKLSLTVDALKNIASRYVMGVDSWDAICVGNPHDLIGTFVTKFSCKLAFNAGKVNWPNLPKFREFERSISEATNSEFRYLNGGVWIGETSFCRDFFACAANTSPLPGHPRSEQGILKTLFPRYHPRVALDYRCEMFQTLQYVFRPILHFV